MYPHFGFESSALQNDLTNVCRQDGCGNYIFSMRVTSESQISMTSENEIKSSATKDNLSAEALRIIEAAKCQDEVQGAVVRRPTSNYMGF